MVSEQAIRDLGESIARRFQPERIYLFGSYASGTAREDSDVDVLVVMPYDGTALGAAADIAQSLSTPVAVDVIVKSREELQERVALNDRFVGSILSTGRLLYADDDL